MPAQPPLRTAVIGLGRMGRYHVQACADTDGLDLVSVFDQQVEHAGQICAAYNLKPTIDLESLIGDIDIAIIAASTTAHCDLAVPLLSAGICCLVEKPIAVTDEDAEAMVDAARTGQATLCVGHTERFNPAIIALSRVLQDGATISQLHARRLNRPTDRIFDVDCVLDLMIHDLDLLQVLNVREIVSIHPHEPAHADQADVVLKTDAGFEAQLQVSRTASEQHRDLMISCGDTTYVLDFGARTLVERTRSSETPIDVVQHDPLRAQLAAFLKVVNHGGDTSNAGIQIASGEEGLVALTWANRVRSKLGLT